ncbi:MAG TPA: 2-succinyl-5-enolpyruvyl-6-hydroxy-3-cyclohexene-1-carboxylic-acid synthase [Acidimicrobiia bacterium]|nr:2-succinyl-5-enolpyruvyl-6-hydroxy-3-cyclohexene-1-carboxylic-acid synthase [Acidimicrobiia bacterium]
MSQPNPSTAQARTIVDELSRHGVDYVVISPGSRSGALAIAFEEHPGITTRVILDERSAAFHALGRSRAAAAPVVALATSGTAVANHLPAVVEADLSLVPLLSISADRPPDMLHVGANQTIDQVGIFGGRTRWSCTIPPAEVGLDLNGYWRTTVSQAVARALGHGATPGPVHLKVAFREPTVPVADDGRSRAEPYPFPIEGRPTGGPWQAHHRARPGAGPVLTAPGYGLLLVGEGDFDPAQLADAAARLRWPVLATATSGLRDSDAVTSYHHLLVAGVPQALFPEAVVTVGRVGPSDRVGALTSLPVPQVQIDRWGVWNDPRRHSSLMIHADPVATLDTIDPAGDDRLRDVWREADATMRSALDDRLAGEHWATGPAVARALVGIDHDLLVAASSMPIRDVDAHFLGGARVIANRGASGIDGFVSTALGAASVGLRTVALAGDLSWLHDVGGLVVDEIGNVVFVVIDNGGGGLFDLLPQAEHAPAFERLFVAPHRVDLSRLGSAYDLSVSVIDGEEVFRSSLPAALAAGGAHVLVVHVERETDLKTRRALDDTARAVCAGLS